jgi:hypothetical protein
MPEDTGTDLSLSQRDTFVAVTCSSRDGLCDLQRIAEASSIPALFWGT